MDQFFMKMFVALQTGLHGVRENRKDSERGATAVEYGLMVALIAGIIVVAVTALGIKVDGAFTLVEGAMP